MEELAERQEYVQVNVDLTDVLQSSGFEKTDLSDVLAAETGQEAENVGSEVEPFVVGSAIGAITDFSQIPLSFLGSPAAKTSTTTGPPVRQVSATGEHIFREQAVQGAPLVGSLFCVHWRPGDSRYAVTGRPVANAERYEPEEKRPTFDEAAVLASARKLVNVPDDTDGTVELVVFPVDGSGFWAYRCSLQVPGKPVDVRAYIAGDLGHTMLSFPISLSDSGYGEGSVYLQKPGGGATTETVALRWLGRNANAELRGPFLDVRPGTGQRLNKADRDFRLLDTDAGFDEVQVWHHVMSMRAYFTALAPEVAVPPLVAVAQDDESDDNAYYLPDRKELRFGMFVSINNQSSARSGDIVRHEFGHAVTDTIVQLGRWLQDTPGRGLSEGYSDYFAASDLDNPVLGDWIMSGPPIRRDLSQAGLSLGASTDEHKVGEAWGGVLWEIRSVLGPSLADLIAIESVRFTGGPRCSLADARAALVQADAFLFPTADPTKGRHHDVVTAGYDARP